MYSCGLGIRWKRRLVREGGEELEEAVACFGEQGEGVDPSGEGGGLRHYGWCHLMRFH